MWTAFAPLARVLRAEVVREKERTPTKWSGGDWRIGRARPEGCARDDSRRSSIPVVWYRPAIEIVKLSKLHLHANTLKHGIYNYFVHLLLSRVGRLRH